MNKMAFSPTEKSAKFEEAPCLLFSRLICCKNKSKGPPTSKSCHHHGGKMTSASLDNIYTGSFEESCLDELNVKVFKESIRSSLIANMKMLGSNVNFLFQIESGDVLPEHLTETCKSFYLKEKNVAFLWSVFVKREDLLEPLVQIGADLHSTFPNEGFTALYLAAFSGCVKSCEWLILNGMDVNLVAKNLSPLHCAVLGNSLDCTQLLLRHCAIIGDTVLHCAVQSNATDCLQQLLDADARVSAVDDKGFTALHVAADRGLEQCLQMLIRHCPEADLNIQTKWRKSTPLHLAAENGYFECCRLLIDGGVDVKALNHKGQTALHLAAKAQSTDCLEVLLDAGSNVNAQDIDGRPPLHAALAKTMEAASTVEVLLKQGADINLPDKYGYTPLHLAGLNELSQCVDYLIMNGADITARTCGGLSALNIVGRKTPDSVNAICRKLDSSVTMSDNKASEKEVQLKLDFRYLLQNSSAGEVGFLKTLEKEGHKQLLEHPLCQAFLHLKWQKIRKFYFCRLLICFVFVVLLTAYVIYALAHECYNAANNDSAEVCEWCVNNFTVAAGNNVSTKACAWCLNSAAIKHEIAKSIRTELSRVCLNDTIVGSVAENTPNETLVICVNNFTVAKQVTVALDELCSHDAPFDAFLRNHPGLIVVTWYSLAFVAILKTIRKIVGLPASRSMRHHLYQLRNIFEWFVILSVFLVSYHWHNWTFEWQKDIGGVAVLLAWTDFMIIVGQLPIFGDYVAMFTRVQTEFFKLLLAYLCLLIGFTVSFCVIFPSDNSFQNPLVGFIKTLAMMTGDLDFDILQENLNAKTSGLLNFSAHITYTLFLLFVTVVLMNLLVGIAVNDIQGLQKSAGLSRLVRQTDLVYYFELALCNSYVPKRMVRLLRQLALVSPQAYRMVVCVKPLHPREKRLPKDIMLAAYSLAKQKKTWNSNCCWLDQLRDGVDSVSYQDQRNLYEGFQQLQEMVQAQNAIIAELARNRCGCVQGQ